jgi:hypothetical protein
VSPVIEAQDEFLPQAVRAVAERRVS